MSKLIILDAIVQYHIQDLTDSQINALLYVTRANEKHNQTGTIEGFAVTLDEIANQEMKSKRGMKTIIKNLVKRNLLNLIGDNIYLSNHIVEFVESQEEEVVVEEEEVVVEQEPAIAGPRINNITFLLLYQAGTGLYFIHVFGETGEYLASYDPTIEEDKKQLVEHIAALNAGYEVDSPRNISCFNIDYQMLNEMTSLDVQRSQATL